jgi:hypothetical protein
MSNTDPTKKPGVNSGATRTPPKNLAWIQVLVKGKQFLLLIGQKIATLAI